MTGQTRITPWSDFLLAYHGKASLNAYGKLFKEG